MNERRLESRYLCADLIRIECLAAGNKFQSVEVLLEDISALGACVQLEKAITVGLPVFFWMGDTRFFGEISYCLYREYGYFAGIRFSDDSKWSSLIFEPQHMVDLRELADASIPSDA